MAGFGGELGAAPSAAGQFNYLRSTPRSHISSSVSDSGSTVYRCAPPTGATIRAL
jgi:hypothetical protein